MTLRQADADELWRAHGSDLLRFATLLVGPHDADDVAVDAFLGAVRNAAGPSIQNSRAYL